MWISGLFCAGMVVIGTAILVFAGKADAGSYQVFYGTVQDRAMAKVSQYDFKGHPYITIEQGDGLRCSGSAIIAQITMQNWVITW